MFFGIHDRRQGGKTVPSRGNNTIGVISFDLLIDIIVYVAYKGRIYRNGDADILQKYHFIGRISCLSIPLPVPDGRILEKDSQLHILDMFGDNSKSSMGVWAPNTVNDQ